MIGTENTGTGGGRFIAMGNFESQLAGFVKIEAKVRVLLLNRTFIFFQGEVFIIGEFITLSRNDILFFNG